MISLKNQQDKKTGYERVDDYRMVQRSTGEVVEAYYKQVPVGTKFFTPEQQENAKKRKEKERAITQAKANNYALGKFIFANAEHRYDDISPQTMARLVYAGTFLSYGEQTLKGRDKQGMTKCDLKRVMGLSEPTFFRFWHEVIGKYLFEDGNSHLYLSNDFKRGNLPKDKNADYQKIYIDAVRTLYKACPASKHRHLGLIFQMLPYINLEYNIICFQPLETNIDKVIPMKADEFCNAIGVTAEKRARIIKEYAKIRFPVGNHSERFCSFVTDDFNIETTRIFVNPRILYRGSDWKKVEVLGCFSNP